MEENGEGTHAIHTEDTLEEKESHDPQEDAELEGLQNGKDSKGKPEKRGKRKAAAAGGRVTPKKPENMEATTPLIDRPARERKSIERFADSVEKEKEKPKEFKIEQGSGTCLRDIPNVVFKLSKRKTSDETVQLLHKLLYNKRVKPNQVKANILQFSGFVWGSNEEKEKSKMKEKLEKIVKENLFQLSDLLDLSITKTTKKEDVVVRVFEFLECPHKTTEKLVQEEEQRLKEKKRTKTPAKGKRKKGSSQTPRKRLKQEENDDEQDEEVEEEEQEEEAQEEPEEEEPEEAPVKKKTIKIKEPSRDAKSSSAKKTKKRSASNSSAHVEDVDEDAEEPVEEPEEVEAEHEEPEEPKRKRSKNKKYEDDTVPVSPKKGVKKSVKKKSVYEPGEEDLDDDIKEVKSKPLSKVSKNEAPKEVKTPAGGSSKEKKKSASSSTKASSKKKKKDHDEDAPEAKSKKGRGASHSASKEESESSPVPPDEDLRAAICELLREADFSTVTFTDVVKQLGSKFDVDLSQNKAHVKTLIQEEISKIVDEDDGDGANEDEETGVNTPERGEKEPIEAVTEE
ncbi:hypothetical protein GOP47_0010221 [Adiantum capillus-veneris]|uniref:DEK-C domain-containing protein n=1 Tax=Adiantum capillus-veneris TaxID=13818 RepID=A0A9D4ZII7_ADICA|nr:hypothetical protein GOP47_0010221 [Adiantum capillus-veneris]